MVLRGELVAIVGRLLSLLWMERLGSWVLIAGRGVSWHGLCIPWGRYTVLDNSDTVRVYLLWGGGGEGRRGYVFFRPIKLESFVPGARLQFIRNRS